MFPFKVARSRPWKPHEGCKWVWMVSRELCPGGLWFLTTTWFLHHWVKCFIIVYLFPTSLPVTSLKPTIFTASAKLHGHLPHLEHSERHGWPCQVRGHTLEDFVSRAQDKQKNALAKSHEASFNAFCDQLQADQLAFEQEQLLSLCRIVHFGNYWNVAKESDLSVCCGFPVSTANGVGSCFTVGDNGLKPTNSKQTH